MRKSNSSKASASRPSASCCGCRARGWRNAASAGCSTTWTVPSACCPRRGCSSPRRRASARRWSSPPRRRRPKSSSSPRSACCCSSRACSRHVTPACAALPSGCFIAASRPPWSRCASRIPGAMPRAWGNCCASAWQRCRSLVRLKPCAWKRATSRPCKSAARACSAMPPPTRKAGRGWWSGCAPGSATATSTALRRTPTIVPNTPGGASSRRGASTRRRCSCSPARSASRPAGGTATTRGATTSSRARQRARCSGCIAKPASGSCMASLPDYAELHCLSNFSFLRGASHPEELVARSAALGYRALALTDECSLAGVVRAHLAARQVELPLIIGSELRCTDGLKVVALATDRASYGRLSSLITHARRAGAKGAYALERRTLEGALEGCLLLWVPASHAPAAGTARDGEWLRERFAGRLWIAVELLTTGLDARHLAALQTLGAALGVPCVAAGDVHMHRRSRRALQDVLTAIRLATPLEAAGFALFANGERHLRPLRRLRELYPAPLLAESLAIAERCGFKLDELRYEYPEEIVPAGETPSTHLRALVERGSAQRWPAGAPAAVRAAIEHELALIGELKFEPFFLTVHDIVQYARSQRILCQGRGSAANSVVCYCLQITEVDPSRMSMLFERFISKERNEPPDIDVDFEHERREEVIQYIYRKYGRERAALAATLIRYRPRSALRDVGKALGFDLEEVDRLASGMQWWDGQQIDPERIRASGFDPADARMRRLIALAAEILGFPRHLSQHVGGFVIARGRLDELVPIENAAMPERTVIEWDKDDLDSLGLLKVDVLGLGMLSAMRRAFDLVNDFGGSRALKGTLSLATIPAEDPRVYDMICRADTVGVFQIESRAQMAMLPRLKPRNYYDLVIEVAIVRPGPIQGEMVHPYLRRRSGEEP